MQPRANEPLEQVVPSQLPDINNGIILRTQGEEFSKAMLARGSWYPGTWFRLIKEATGEKGRKIEHIKYVYEAKVSMIGGVDRTQMVAPHTTPLFIIATRPFTIGDIQYVE